MLISTAAAETKPVQGSASINSQDERNSYSVHVFSVGWLLNKHTICSNFSMINLRIIGHQTKLVKHFMVYCMLDLALQMSFFIEFFSL